jgi:hypothetical protein
METSNKKVGSSYRIGGGGTQREASGEINGKDGLKLQRWTLFILGLCLGYGRTYM